MIRRSQRFKRQTFAVRRSKDGIGTEVDHLAMTEYPVTENALPLNKCPTNKEG
jgi:hypothetical protein